MTREDFFQPSEALGAKAAEFLSALAGEMTIPAGVTQAQVVRTRIQVAVYLLLKIAENHHVVELNARNASEDDAADESKGFMTGIGIGLASYLVTSTAPMFMLAHVANAAQRTIAMLTTPPEGPKQ